MMPENNRDTPTGNMRQQFGKFWPCGFGVMQMDRHMDKHTYTTLHLSRGKK